MCQMLLFGDKRVCTSCLHWTDALKNGDIPPETETCPNCGKIVERPKCSGCAEWDADLRYCRATGLSMPRGDADCRVPMMYVPVNSWTNADWLSRLADEGRQVFLSVRSDGRIASVEERPIAFVDVVVDWKRMCTVDMDEMPEWLDAPGPDMPPRERTNADWLVEIAREGAGLSMEAYGADEGCEDFSMVFASVEMDGKRLCEIPVEDLSAWLGQPAPETWPGKQGEERHG